MYLSQVINPFIEHVKCRTRNLPYYQVLTSAQWRRCCSYGWILWIMIHSQVSTHVMKYLTMKTQIDRRDYQGTIKIHVYKFFEYEIKQSEGIGLAIRGSPLLFSRKLRRQPGQSTNMKQPNSKSLQGAGLMQRTTNLIEFNWIDNNTKSTIQAMQWLLQVTNN